jgi:hypothetical protein
MRHAFANANVNPYANINANGDAGCVGYANVNPYANINAYCYSSGFGNAYRDLRAGNLYDSCYHWHDNPGRDRYWQPL